jgi:hypothetical protein
MERYERAFDALGWVGFVLLTPVALLVFQVQPAAQFMQTKLGFAGQPVLWTLVAFGLVILRILFGGEKIILPLFLGFVVGFLLLSLVAQIGFMRWFWEPAEQLFFLKNPRLIFIVGAAVLFMGLLYSHFRRVRLLLQFLTLLVAPFVALLVGGALEVL